MQITVVICTYQREDLLANTLATLARQTLPATAFATLVVDNARSERVRNIAQCYGVGYVHEPRLGLSHARNRGLREAITPWVLYLDDDVRAPPELLEQFERRLKVAEYAALGGQFTHRFATPPPEWLRKYYGAPMQPSPQEQLGELPADRYLYGCVLALRRKVVLDLDGFATELGMQGGGIGFGEEDELQIRLRERGYRIFYDPAISIEHLVQPYKYRLRSQLRTALAHGRASVALRPQQPGFTRLELLKRYGLITVQSLPFNLARWLFKPNYRWQHLAIDTLGKYYYAYGRYAARPQ